MLLFSIKRSINKVWNMFIVLGNQFFWPTFILEKTNEQWQALSWASNLSRLSIFLLEKEKSTSYGILE